jgi:hypothetical protein
MAGLGQAPACGPRQLPGPAALCAAGPYGSRAGGGYIPDYIVLTMRPAPAAP